VIRLGTEILSVALAILVVLGGAIILVVARAIDTVLDRTG